MMKLYEADNHILIHAGDMEPSEHRHMAAHIMVSLHGTMRVTADGVETCCRGVMIPSGISHVVDACGGAVLAFLYDAATAVAEQIRELRFLADGDCGAIAAWYAALERDVTADHYGQFERACLACLGIRNTGGRILDERIRWAVEYIRRGSSGKLTCREVADAVCLSQSRFSHLFKEQVGMTFASYLIYQRILAAYMEILEGKSVTEAALNAGFSSSGHLADVNRRVFGLAVSSVTRDMVFWKVR